MTQPETENSVSCRCKQCLEDIPFEIPPEKIQEKIFPIALENVHGDPPHKLIIYLNKNLEIQSFEIEDIVEKSTFSEHILEEVLGEFGLTQAEINLYFHCTSLGPVSPGEMALMAELPVDDVREIATKFVEKGLFKEIIGATQYFQALPPYAALLAQLEQFGGFISDIKDETPRQLQRSFSSFEAQAEGVKNLTEFVSYLSDIKENVSTQLGEQKTALDGNLDQLKNQQAAVDFIGTLKDQSASLLDREMEGLTKQLGSIQDKISRNLEKLRLGVILQTVQDVIQKIISKEVEAVRQSFQAEFGEPFRNMLSQLSTKIESVTSSAGNIEENLRDLFSTITTQFDVTLSEAQMRVEGISDQVLKSFADLRNTFSENVIMTLDSVLEQILNKLHLSTTTVKEFWDEAKRVIKATMGKDVWFIRSPEGMRAQINDEVSRAKMRVLVLAPNLSDVDVPSLLAAPKFVNIRVACNIDPTDPKHQEILDTLGSWTNITCRRRSLQNLWGINRDFEEIILGIVSEAAPVAPGAYDVAAIGSILAEHIKILVPILEDAWMGSRKEIGYLAQEGTAPEEEMPAKGRAAPARQPAARAREPAAKVEEPAPRPAARARLAPRPPEEEPEIAAPPRPMDLTSEEEETPPPAREAPAASSAAAGPEIANAIQTFVSNFDSYSSGPECAKALTDLRDFIFERKGFSVVLNDMKNWANQVGHGTWDAKAKETLKKRVENW